MHYGLIPMTPYGSARSNFYTTTSININQTPISTRKIPSISIPTNKGSKVSLKKNRPFLNYPLFSVEFTSNATAHVT
jgi:hypothetical protein